MREIKSKIQIPQNWLSSGTRGYDKNTVLIVFPPENWSVGDEEYDFNKYCLVVSGNSTTPVLKEEVWSDYLPVITTAGPETEETFRQIRNWYDNPVRGEWTFELLQKLYSCFIYKNYSFTVEDIGNGNFTLQVQYPWIDPKNEVMIQKGALHFINHTDTLTRLCTLGLQACIQAEAHEVRANLRIGGVTVYNPYLDCYVSMQAAKTGTEDRVRITDTSEVVDG